MEVDKDALENGGRSAELSSEPASIHTQKHFHLHLVSDASGETLTTIAKAAVVQLQNAKPNRHMHPLIRNPKQLATVLQHIETSPGIVLYTLMNANLAKLLEARCADIGVPCVPVLAPVLQAFEAYLKTPSRAVVGGQHTLDGEYFRRIEAMDYTLTHDDSQRTEDLEKADIVLIGASRTSKTPTSIYLAGRGYKTANVSLVPTIPLPPALEKISAPFVVGLVATVERIADIRRNRMQTLASESFDNYVSEHAIKAEMDFTRKLCAKNRWTVVDVTKKSIEETAATIISIYEQRGRQQNR